MTIADYEQKEPHTHDLDLAYHRGLDAGHGTRALCEYKRITGVKTLSYPCRTTVWECQNCFNIRAINNDDQKYSYCPNCGAKIEKYVEEE